MTKRDDLPEILQPESQESYKADSESYFRNVQGKKTRSGMSADDLAAAGRHLPSGAQEAAYAERVELAADKTKRSGARVNNSSAVPGIFFRSLKENSELIDQFTPGKYQEPTEAKPPDQQVAPTGFFEAAEAVVEGFCLDCQQAPPNTSYVLGVTIAKEEDAIKCARHVSVGATVLYQICMSCWESAKELARDKTPLVLVFDGGIIPESEVALAQKYGFPVNLHEGVEKTKSQWEMIKRAERLMETLWEYIRIQHHDSRVFVRNRVKKG